MKIKPNEELIQGQWVVEGDKLIPDASLERIDWLIRHFLVKTGESEGGWTILFKNPENGDIWELFYSQSELQGGGPPSLRKAKD